MAELSNPIAQFAEIHQSNYQITQLPNYQILGSVYVVAAVVPRMARLTRLRISGIL
jgi:hypothetical protein